MGGEQYQLVTLLLETPNTKADVSRMLYGKIRRLIGVNFLNSFKLKVALKELDKRSNVGTVSWNAVEKMKPRVVYKAVRDYVIEQNKIKKAEQDEADAEM